MRKRTANKIVRSRPRGGFTLVELLLALAVLTLLGALAVQAINGTLFAARLQQSAEQLRTSLTDARLKAIEAGQPMFFRCQLGSGNYRVEPATSTLDSLGQPTAVGFAGTLEENIVFRSMNCSGQCGVPAPSGPSGVPDGAWSTPLVFMPTGVASDAEIVLGLINPDSDRERQLAITLRGITCTATLSEPLDGGVAR